MRGITSAASSAYIRDKWFGGSKPDYAQVAADSFGNVLADQVVSGMAKPSSNPFFQIGSGTLGESFSYSGTGVYLDTPSPFALDASEIGRYEPGPHYLSGAYIADVDTDRYLGQMSTETNPSNRYENIVDQYALGIDVPKGSVQSIGATSTSVADADDLISLEELQAIVRPTFPRAKASDMERYLPALNRYLPDYDMTNPGRIAAFLEQVSVETGGFASTAESFYYKTLGGLHENWKRLFPTRESEVAYLRAPEIIANYVYALKAAMVDLTRVMTGTAEVAD